MKITYFFCATLVGSLGLFLAPRIAAAASCPGPCVGISATCPSGYDFDTTGSYECPVSGSPLCCVTSKAPTPPPPSKGGTCEGTCVSASLCPTTAPAVGKGTCDPDSTGATPLCCVKAPSVSSPSSAGSACAGDYGGECFSVSGGCDPGNCYEEVKPKGSEVLCPADVSGAKPFCCKKMTGDALKKCNEKYALGASTSACTPADEGKTAQKKRGDLGSYDCAAECKSAGGAAAKVVSAVSGLTGTASCADDCKAKYQATVPAVCHGGKWVEQPDLGSSMVISNPLGANADLPTLIGRVISTFLGMIGAASLLVFVYAGVRYLTAGGSEANVTAAKDTMKYAFIGIAVILFAYVITTFFFQALTSGAPSAAPAAGGAVTLPTLPTP